MPAVTLTEKPRAANRKTGLATAACLGLLVFSSTAHGNPAGDRNEAARTAPPREATRLSSRPAVATRRPPFGWPALVTEARKYIGTNPTARKKLWCATFMNMVLARTGYAGTGSDAARSFASYGKRINEPRIGAIAVLSRGKHGGHVGIVTGVDANGNPIIISGNHGRRVGEAVYSRSRVIAYVMPVERAGATQLASAAPSLPRMSDADDDGGVPSPIEELLAAINAERSEEAAPQAPYRAPPRRAVARPAYRVVQQAADVELPRPRIEAAFRVSAVTPLPRERAAEPMPLPRNRPQ